MPIIDSSALIHILNGTDIGKNIAYKHRTNLKITAFTVHEVLFGYPKSKREYVKQLITSVDVLPFDQNAAEISVQIREQLQKKGRMITEMDILIAAICIRQQQEIITTDKQFLQIKGLKVDFFK